jgi:hypothetical protein
VRYAVRPRKRSTTKTIRKRKNRNLAIPIAAPATPLKPSAPAISPTIRNKNAHRNMECFSQSGNPPCNAIAEVAFRVKVP